MYRIIEPDATQWDAFVMQHPRGHALQLSAWGQHKCDFGWSMSRVGLTAVDDNKLVAGAQLLYRPVARRVGTIAYLPMGPYVTADNQWATLWRAVQKRAIQHRAVFLKWEPGIYINETPPDFAQWGFMASPQTIQPPRTILIDVRADDDTLLARMNQGTRRKIRKSLKSGIRYYEGTAADVERFTEMMHTTGTRNAFGVHAPEYYAKAYELFAPSDTVRLFMAEHEGQPLAGIMVFAVGQQAWYLYGASANIKRELMATYGIQWQAIQWARARGCHYYDMWGIPDEDEDTLEAQFQQRSDGLWGVYGFKRGWGGQVIRSAGTWDRPYNAWVYNAYRAILWVQHIMQQ